MSDIVQSKRPRTTTQRRAKSAPSLGKISDPPIILHGKYNGSPITVYGEIHNMIDNRFYKALDVSNKILFVEHSTVLCDAPKKSKNTYKGSEWIWYEHQGHENLICIDNRVEEGMPSGMEEKVVRAIDEKSSSDGTLSIFIKSSLHTFIKKNIKEKFKQFNLVDIYNEFMVVLQEQMNRLLKEGDLVTPEQIENKNKLVDNIVKLGAIIVDMNIIENIKQYADGSKKPILIFVGLGHAHRLVSDLFIKEGIFHAIDANVPIEALEDAEMLVYR